MSTHQNKENILPQNRKLTNTFMSYEQSTPAFECKTVNRSSKKQKLPKQENRPSTGEKLINNFIIEQPFPSNKKDGQYVASFIVDEFEDDETNDMASQGLKKRVYQGLDITVDKPKLIRPLISRNPNTTATTSGTNDAYYGIQEEFDGKLTKIKRKCKFSLTDKKQSTFYYEQQEKPSPPKESQVTQTESSKPRNLRRSPAVSLTIAKQDLSSKPIPRSHTKRCILRRAQTNDTTIFSIFDEHMQPLLHAKRLQTIVKTYVISASPLDFRRDSQSYIGRIRSNVFDTSFSVYLPVTKSGVQVKKIIATIDYSSNIFSGDPKKMTVFLPMLNSGQKMEEILTDKDQGLRCDKYKGKVKTFCNKMMEENSIEETASYNNRASIRSVKNFILINENTKEQHLLLGKIAIQDYNLDVSHPLSILQAFGIALTRF